MVSEREGIDIGILAVYLPSILAAAYVSYRHGFIRQLGWIYLVIFCALRIAGGAIGILSARNPTSTDDAEWAAILSSIGLSPLLLAAMGLLKRVIDFVEQKSTRVLILRIIHIPCILALILAIVGGTRVASTDPSKHSSGQTYEKAGGILFLLVYVALLAVAAVTMADIRSLPWGEKRILIAVLAALPFLAVRLLYSLLTEFEDNSTFNILDGNVTVQLCMAVIEEFIVTIFFLVAGLAAPSLKNMQVGMDQIPLGPANPNDPKQTQHAVGGAFQSWGRTTQV